MNPDKAAAKRFLDRLDPGGGVFTFQTFDDSRQKKTFCRESFMELSKNTFHYSRSSTGKARGSS